LKIDIEIEIEFNTWSNSIPKRLNFPLPFNQNKLSQTLNPSILKPELAESLEAANKNLGAATP